MPKRDKRLTEPYVRWVEAEMAEREWKPAELARRAKMHQSVISRMLRREVATDMEILERLAKAFGKPLPELGPIDRGGDASPQQRRPSELANPSGASPKQRATSDAPNPRRSEAGYLLRALTEGDPQLSLQVREGGAGYADIAAIAAHQAGQMLADRVAALFKETFENNEIANTTSGRAFTITFLEKVVDDFGALGLNVTDMARYVIELRRSQASQKAEN